MGQHTAPAALIILAARMAAIRSRMSRGRRMGSLWASTMAEACDGVHGMSAANSLDGVFILEYRQVLIRT